MSILSKLDANKRDKGFTLIELVVVLIVISVLTVFAMASKPKVMNMVHTYQLDAQLREIMLAVEVNKGDAVGYSFLTAVPDGSEPAAADDKSAKGTIKSFCENGTLKNNTICNPAVAGQETPFGGSYAIFNPNPAGTAADSYQIEVTGATNLPVALANSLKSVGEVGQTDNTAFTLSVKGE